MFTGARSGRSPLLSGSLLQIEGIVPGPARGLLPLDAAESYQAGEAPEAGLRRLVLPEVVFSWAEFPVTVQPGPDSRVGNSLVLKSASGPTDAQIVGAQRRFSKPTGSFPPGRLRSKDGSTLRSPTRRLGVVWPRSSDIARRVLRLRGASRRKQRISLRMMGPAFLQGQPGWRA